MFARNPRMVELADGKYSKMARRDCCFSAGHKSVPSSYVPNDMANAEAL